MKKTYITLLLILFCTIAFATNYAKVVNFAMLGLALQGMAQTIKLGNGDLYVVNSTIINGREVVLGI